MAIVMTREIETVKQNLRVRRWDYQKLMDYWMPMAIARRSD